MKGVIFVLAVLATWRVAHVLLRENGPFSVFRRARRALGVVYDPEDEDRFVSFKYEITVCMWCLSVWAGSVSAALILWAPEWFQYMIFTPFAISGAVVCLDKMFGAGQ